MKKENTAKMLKTAYEKYGTPTYIFDWDVARGVYESFDRALNLSYESAIVLNETKLNPALSNEATTNPAISNETKLNPALSNETTTNPFHHIKLCFAMKTNPFLVGKMAQIADRIEVCSIGEFHICKSLNIPPEKLFLSGVLKREQDVNEMLDYCKDKAMITIESPEHLRMINNWCKMQHEKNQCGGNIKVYLRLSSGNQFGMDKTTILQIIKNRDCYPDLDFAGIHFFSGTQKKSTKKNAKEIAMLDEFLQQIEAETGLAIGELEYGTGTKAAYFDDEKDTRVEAMQAIGECIRNMTYKCQATIEMGRAFAADCGYYMTRVWDIKHTEDKNYCIVDGGIHQLNYDGQIRGMYMPEVMLLQGNVINTKDTQNTNADNIASTYTICGALCTANDILIQELNVESISINDVLVFCNTGAYSMTEGASLFLSHDLPAIAIYSEQDGFETMRDKYATWTLNTPRD